MELGQLLKQARLEAGLSQRQLCGQEITRNMLSQIENGSARPSMDTLRYLAARLEKPVGYFLEEQLASPNQRTMDAARQAYMQGSHRECLQTLEAYQEPDAVFDPERWLLEMLAATALAEQALEENRNTYAQKLLEQAMRAGERTPYDSPSLRRERSLLEYRADPANAEAIKTGLPDNLTELLLRAEAAIAQKNWIRGGQLLDAAENRNAKWYVLRGQVCYSQKEYTQAAAYYKQAEQALPEQVLPKLEQCYEALEDYKMAYHYARKQREYKK